MPTSFAQPLDGAIRSTLAASYAPGDASISLATGDGPKFGTPTPTAPVRVTLVADVANLGDMTRVAYYLTTGRTGDTLTGWTHDGGTDQAFAAGSGALVLVNGGTFSEIHDAVNALVPDRNYVHTQSTPASVWTITHNLGKRPSVTVVDSAESVVVGEVSYPDVNTVTITFSGAFSGAAFLN